MRPFLLTIFIGAIVFIGGLALFFTWFCYSFSNCIDHEHSRLTFHLKDKGYDLSAMLDSFKNINKQFSVPDSLTIGYLGYKDSKVNDCYCCCIETVDYKELFFGVAPKEIYRISVERHRNNAGFTNEYYENIGHIDIVYSFAHGNWRCALTSKLDSAGKLRVLKRLDTAVLSRLPIIRDTLKHDGD